MHSNIENRMFVIACFAVLVAFVAGYNFHRGNIRKELEGAAAENQEMFKTISVVFDLLTKNTDTMMRFSHYTDNHTEVVPFCPECTNAKDISGPPVAGDVPVEPSVKQLYQDSVEIHDTFKRIAGSLSNQRFTLRARLEDLKFKLPVLPSE